MDVEGMTSRLPVGARSGRAGNCPIANDSPESPPEGLQKPQELYTEDRDLPVYVLNHRGTRFPSVSVRRHRRRAPCGRILNWRVSRPVMTVGRV
jgi:hypothetical protein